MWEIRATFGGYYAASHKPAQRLIHIQLHEALTHLEESWHVEWRGHETWCSSFHNAVMQLNHAAGPVQQPTKIRRLPKNL
jgi:hypothetical protein